MKKSFVFLALAILVTVLYGLNVFGKNTQCYEIVEIGKPLYGQLLLDKCKGRTWTMVHTSGTPSEILGYVTEEKEDEVKTIVWTRVHDGGGFLSLNEKK